MILTKLPLPPGTILILKNAEKNWNRQYQFTPILLLAFDFEIRLSRVLFRIGTKSGHYNNLKVNQKSKTAILDVIINF